MKTVIAVLAGYFLFVGVMLSAFAQTADGIQEEVLSEQSAAESAEAKACDPPTRSGELTDLMNAAERENLRGETSTSNLTLARELLYLGDMVLGANEYLEWFEDDFRVLAKTGKVGKKDVDGWIARDFENIRRYMKAFETHLNLNRTDVSEFGAHLGKREVRYGFIPVNVPPKSPAFGRRSLHRHLYQIDRKFRRMAINLRLFANGYAKLGSVTTDFERRLMEENLDRVDEYYRYFRAEVRRVEKTLRYLLSG